MFFETVGTWWTPETNSKISWTWSLILEGSKVWMVGNGEVWTEESLEFKWEEDEEGIVVRDLKENGKDEKKGSKV